MFRKLKSKVSSISSEITSSLATIGNDILNITDDINLSRSNHNSASTKSVNASSSDLASIHSSGEIESPHTATQDLLHRYESEWQTLHSNADLNVQKMKSLQKDVSNTETHVLQSGKSVQIWQSEVQELPDLVTNIQQIADRIVEIRSLAVILEDDLVVLEQYCLAKEVAVNKQKELAKLETYRNLKNSELQKVEAGKQKEQAAMLRREEFRKSEEMKEKQLVYQKAFEQDMKKYMSHQERHVRGASLESVEIQPSESDQKALDDFLDAAPIPEPDRDNAPDPSDDTSSHQSRSDDEVAPLDNSSNSDSEPLGVDEVVKSSEDPSRLRSETESTSKTDQSDHSQGSHQALEDSLQWDEEGDDINTISGGIHEEPLM